MLPTMLATAGASHGPSVDSAVGTVAEVVGAAFDVISTAPILAAMFGLALLIPAFKVIKKARSTSN